MRRTSVRAGQRRILTAGVIASANSSTAVAHTPDQ
jgi:hypothetical protein